MQEAHVLAGALEAAGIVCRWIDRIGRRPAPGWDEKMSGVPEAVLGTDSREADRDTECGSETLLITDSREAAREAARCGTVCIACADDGGFFEGAQLVVEGLAELEPEVLEEFLLRTQGFPVTVARTERLVIREIAKEDFARLRGISMQAGMEHALRGGGPEGPDGALHGCSVREGSDSMPYGYGVQERPDGAFRRCDVQDEDGDTPPQMFSDEYLSMYIKYVYKFYGYGLWSVCLHDGTLIGCCGFCNLDMDVPDGEGNMGCDADRHCKTTELEPGNSDSVQESAEPGADGRGKTAELDFRSRGDGQESGADACVPVSAPRRLELQYMLAREAQGHGYAQEMCRAALRFAFARTDADEVWVCVHRDNAPSVRLAERLGFSRVDGNGADELWYYRLSISE